MMKPLGLGYKKSISFQTSACYTTLKIHSSSSVEYIGMFVVNPKPTRKNSCYS